VTTLNRLKMGKNEPRLGFDARGISQAAFRHYTSRARSAMRELLMRGDLVTPLEASSSKRI
jgi:hypothetical protein